MGEKKLDITTAKKVTIEDLQDQINNLRRELKRERERLQILQQGLQNQQYQADPGQQIWAIHQRSEEILQLIERYQGELRDQQRIQQEQLPVDIQSILEEIRREHARINQTLRASRLCM